jgi:hypothetical protein
MMTHRERFMAALKGEAAVFRAFCEAPKAYAATF